MANPRAVVGFLTFRFFFRKKRGGRLDRIGSLVVGQICCCVAWIFRRPRNLVVEMIPTWHISIGLPPTQDASHHQDDITFLIGNPYKPSFPLLLGGG